MALRWILLVLFGAFLCTFGDHLHATHGVLTYPHVAFFDQAAWVFPLFAGATLVCVLAARPFIAWGRGGVVTPSFRLVVADVLGFFAAYAYTSFAPADRPNVTFLVLTVAFFVRVIAENRPTWQVVYCLGLGIAGSLFEAGLSSTGAFHYLHPDLLGVPRWLSAIYLHAGLAAAGLSTWMIQSSKADNA